MIEILMVGVILSMIYFIGSDIVSLVMNYKMKNKIIKYKKNRKLQIKDVNFKSFKEVELIINDYGIGRIIKCQYEDIEII